MSLFVRVLTRTVVQSIVDKANPAISLKRIKYLHSESKRLSILFAVVFTMRRTRL